MKKIFTFPNIQAVIFLILSVAETVVLALYKPMPLGTVLMIQLFSLMSIAEIRFAYWLAFLSNRWHSLWNRRYSSEEDDEPSDLAVGITKAIGYIILLVLQIVLFI